jgi:hypothetical protein
VVRAVAGLIGQVDRLGSEVRVLVADRDRERPLAPGPERDPWRGLGH